MKKPDYPLEQVQLIKKKKLEEAEKILKEKKEALEKEKAKLAALEKERDAVKVHRDDKLSQFRSTLDQGTTTDKIQQMKAYLKEVEEKLKVHQKKVSDQTKNVDVAQKNVDTAREEMLKKQQEVEKMNLHKKEWEKEIKKIIEQKESLEMDETGSTMFSRKQQAAKKHKDS